MLKDGVDLRNTIVTTEGAGIDMSRIRDGLWVFRRWLDPEVTRIMVADDKFKLGKHLEMAEWSINEQLGVNQDRTKEWARECAGGTLTEMEWKLLNEMGGVLAVTSGYLGRRVPKMNERQFDEYLKRYLGKRSGFGYTEANIQEITKAQRKWWGVDRGRFSEARVIRESIGTQNAWFNLAVNMVEKYHIDIDTAYKELETEGGNLINFIGMYVARLTGDESLGGFVRGYLGPIKLWREWKLSSPQEELVLANLEEERRAVDLIIRHGDRNIGVIQVKSISDNTPIDAGLVRLDTRNQAVNLRTTIGDLYTGDKSRHGMELMDQVDRLVALAAERKVVPYWAWVKTGI